MYKLVVQLLDLNVQSRNPIMHEIHSKHFSSMQDAFESFNGKEAFETYLEIERKLMKDIEAVKNGEYISD